MALCNANYLSTLRNIVEKSLKEAELINPFDVVENINLLSKQGISCEMFSFAVKSENKLIKNIFILRLYKVKNTKNAIKEYKLLKILKECGAPVPIAYYFEEHNPILNKPFMVLEKIKGEQAGNYFDDNERAKEIIDKMAEALVDVHNVKLTKFNFVNENHTFLRQENNLLKEFFFLQKVHLLFFAFSPIEIKRFVKIVKKIDSLKSKSFQSAALLHMDYDHENVLLSDSKCVIIDWTEATIGDPAYDVAWTYHMLTISDKTKQDLGNYFVNCYKKHSKVKLNNLVFYKDLVAFKMASYYGLCPFGSANVLRIYMNLVDQLFGNVFGRLIKNLYLHKLKNVRNVKNKPKSVWDDIIGVQQYFFQYFEKTTKK